MWTYLAILLSVFLLAGVFVRRVVLSVRGRTKGKMKRSIKQPSPHFPEETKEQKISREEKFKVEELYQKAESKLKAGREDDAIKYFVQALAVDEAHTQTQLKLAMLYMQKQMYGAAAELFRGLGALTGEAVHYSHLGLALYNQNLFEEAKEAYQKAVELDPSRAQRFASLAQVYRAVGELQNAVIALNKALELEKDNLDFLFFLSDVQAELGNLNEAVDVVNRILEFDPDSKEAKARMKTLKKMAAVKEEEGAQE